MGTIVRKIALLATVAALLIPGGAQAESTSYGPGDYSAGPSGGSSNATTVSADTATGELLALQYQFTAVSGSLGCTGQGPFVHFDVPHTGDIDDVSVRFSGAVVSPYAFLKVSVLKDGVSEDTFVATKNVRGAILLDGTILGPGSDTVTLALDETATGDSIIRVGLEVSSNCPSLDGGRIVIEDVTVAVDAPDAD